MALLPGVPGLLGCCSLSATVETANLLGLRAVEGVAVLGSKRDTPDSFYSLSRRSRACLAFSSSCCSSSILLSSCAASLSRC